MHCIGEALHFFWMWGVQGRWENFIAASASDKKKPSAPKEASYSLNAIDRQVTESVNSKDNVKTMTTRKNLRATSDKTNTSALTVKVKEASKTLITTNNRQVTQHSKSKNASAAITKPSTQDDATKNRLHCLIAQLDRFGSSLSKNYKTKIIDEIVDILKCFPTLAQTTWHSDPLKGRDQSNLIHLLVKNGASQTQVSLFHKACPSVDKAIEVYSFHLFVDCKDDNVALYLARLWKDSKLFPLTSVMDNRHISQKTLVSVLKRHPESIDQDVLQASFRKRRAPEVLRVMATLFRPREGQNEVLKWNTTFGYEVSSIKAFDALSTYISHFSRVEIGGAWEWKPTAVVKFFQGLRINTRTRSILVSFPSFAEMQEVDQATAVGNAIRAAFQQNKVLEKFTIFLKDAQCVDLESWEEIMKGVWGSNEGPPFFRLESRNTTRRLNVEMNKDRGTELECEGIDHRVLDQCAPLSDVSFVTVSYGNLRRSVPARLSLHATETLNIWKNIPQLFCNLRRLNIGGVLTVSQTDVTSFVVHILQNCHSLETLESNMRSDLDILPVFEELKKNKTLRSMKIGVYSTPKPAAEAACLKMLSTNTTIQECYPWGHYVEGDLTIQYYLALNQCGRGKANQDKASAATFKLTSLIPAFINQKALSENWREALGVAKAQRQKDDLCRSMTYHFLKASIGTLSPFLIDR
jgi:hypothetical protein